MPVCIQIQKWLHSQLSENLNCPKIIIMLCTYLDTYKYYVSEITMIVVSWCLNTHKPHATGVWFVWYTVVLCLFHMNGIVWNKVSWILYKKEIRCMVSTHVYVFVVELTEICLCNWPVVDNPFDWRPSASKSRYRSNIHSSFDKWQIWIICQWQLAQTLEIDDRIISRVTELTTCAAVIPRNLNIVVHNRSLRCGRVMLTTKWYWVIAARVRSVTSQLPIILGSSALSTPRKSRYCGPDMHVFITGNVAPVPV